MRNKILTKDTKKNYNDYCRLKTKEYILRDILIDLEICRIEGWCHKEYISSLKKEIDLVYKKFKSGDL